MSECISNENIIIIITYRAVIIIIIIITCRAVNGYPELAITRVVNYERVYAETKWIEQEKLTEEEQEDDVRDESLSKFEFCVDCDHNFSSLYCVFSIIIGCVTNFLQMDAYLGWLLCEMMRMLTNI